MSNSGLKFQKLNREKLQLNNRTGVIFYIKMSLSPKTMSYLLKSERA